MTKKRKGAKNQGNPIHKDLRTPKYKMRVVTDKKKKSNKELGRKKVKSFEQFMKEASIKDDPEIAKMDAQEKILKDKITSAQRNDKPKQAQNRRKELANLKVRRRERAVDLRNRDRIEPEE